MTDMVVSFDISTWGLVFSDSGCPLSFRRETLGLADFGPGAASFGLEPGIGGQYRHNGLSLGELVVQDAVTGEVRHPLPIAQLTAGRPIGARDDVGTDTPRAVAECSFRCFGLVGFHRVRVPSEVSALLIVGLCGCID